MPRLSPFSLRPPRFNKQKSPQTESLIETEGPKEWEDARCMICMEPPHNAILLHCASYSQGCRPYLCDTSARHSNCYKQFRRNNKSRFSSKTMRCPLCRGEVFNEAMNVPTARGFMNAKPRSCAFEGCEFSGTYAQLEAHSKAEHPRCVVRPKVDPLKRRMWEQRMRDDEDAQNLNAIGGTVEIDDDEDEIVNAIGGNPLNPVEIDDDEDEIMNATGGNPRRVVERNTQLAELMLTDGFPPSVVDRYAENPDFMWLPPHHRPENVNPRLTHNDHLQFFEGLMRDAYAILLSSQERSRSTNHTDAFFARLLLREQVAMFYGWPSF